MSSPGNGGYMTDRKKKLDEKGATMVEVIAGFVILLLLSASFFGIMQLSSNLITAAHDKANAASEFEAEYYKKGAVTSALKGDNDRLTAKKVSENISFVKANDAGYGNAGEEIPVNAVLLEIKDKTDEYAYPVYSLAGGDR